MTMQPTIHETQMRHAGSRSGLGATALIMMLALAAALAGSSSANTEQPASRSDGRASAPMAEGRIAFARVEGGNGLPDIFTMDANGNNSVQLTTDPGADYAPAWSPDSSKIAFQSDRGGGYRIYVMDANGGNQHTAGPAGGLYASWSPDGSKIAFTLGAD